MKNRDSMTWNEAVRLRPAMYVGAVNHRGFVDLLKGIFASFLAETKANRCAILLLDSRKASIQFDAIKAPILRDCSIIGGSPINTNYLELGVLNALSDFYEIEFFDTFNNSIEKQEYRRGQIHKEIPRGIALDCD